MLKMRKLLENTDDIYDVFEKAIWKICGRKASGWYDKKHGIDVVWGNYREKKDTVTKFLEKFKRDYNVDIIVSQSPRYVNLKIIK